MTLRTIATLVAGKLDPAQDRHAYEEGTWTPVLTFATPGDLAATYSNQLGYYTRIGNLVFWRLTLSTSAFTHTTASGQCRVTGLPFVVGGPTSDAALGLVGGITKAGYTHFGIRTQLTLSYLAVVASGSGVAGAFVTAADMPSGGTVALIGHGFYQV